MLAGQSGLEPLSHSRHATELQDCRLCDMSQLGRADAWQRHTMHSRPSITGRHKLSYDKPVRACLRLPTCYLPACLR